VHRAQEDGATDDLGGKLIKISFGSDLRKKTSSRSKRLTKKDWG
jgi:hypothetical protein